MIALKTGFRCLVIQSLDSFPPLPYNPFAYERTLSASTTFTHEPTQAGPTAPCASVSPTAAQGTDPAGQAQRFGARLPPAGGRLGSQTTTSSIRTHPPAPLLPAGHGFGASRPPAPAWPLQPLPGVPGSRAAPAPPSRLAAVRARVGAHSTATGGTARFSAARPVRAAAPPPAGPLGRRPTEPLTLHHLLRLLLARAAFRRHVDCSSTFRNLSPQAPQPIRTPDSVPAQPMESHTRFEPRRAGAASAPHGNCSSPERPCVPQPQEKPASPPLDR